MKRITSILLIIILCVSMTVPAFSFSGESSRSHTEAVKGVRYDSSFKASWDSYFDSGIWSTSIDKKLCWQALDYAVRSVGYGGFDSYFGILKACNSINAWFNDPMSTFWKHPLESVGAVDFQLVAGSVFSSLSFRVQKHSEYGYIIVESKTGRALCNSSGAFPYFKEIEVTSGSDQDETTDELGGKWLPITGVSSVNNIVSMAVFDDIVAQLQAQGEQVDMAYYNNKTLGGIQHRTKQVLGVPLVYCDSKGRPYRVQLSENSFAVNQDNDYYTGSNSSGSSSGDTTIYDQGTTIYDQGSTENNTLIDVDNNTVWFPDGTLNYIENLLYDESTKTYYVDAHQEYNIETNTYITNNYRYEYHINYTSITYIGASEEYNKVYELYYQLPDGRNSADLTAEELKALNVNVDVVPYIRSADNTALRLLYHFDGNVNDSSYWNYATSFVWNKGASITYLESNAFNGCLYLDETEHEFEINASRGIGSQDFTLQWRMYGSATQAPVSDSWVSIGNDQLFTFSGSYITFGGTQYAVPVGNWYEVALIRQSGTLRLYLNGIQVGSKTDSSVLGKRILFHFGNQRQTYLQLDELRLLNYALVEDGTAYTPTAVPYDTNLALVLPDSTTPVADEYWNLKTDGNLLPYYNFTEAFDLDPWLKDWFGRGSSNVIPNYCGPQGAGYLNYHSNVLSISHSGSFLTITNNSSVSGYVDIPLYHINQYHNIQQHIDGYVFDSDKSYSCSILLADGSLYSFSFSVDKYLTSSGPLGSVSLGNGCDLRVYASFYSNAYYCWFGLNLPAGASVDFVYWELKEGEPNTGHEFVSSIAPVDSDFKTPTLAVRTDLEITGHQIGGVRPSLPKKGLVWALVEDGRITSLQIYNGQAWEAVDGRIWTGSRWVPYYAYDVLLLKDLYDVIESDPSQEYIYTEQGFWSWFQRAWNQQLITRLDALLAAMGGGFGGSGSGSGSSGESFLNKIGDAFSDGLAALIKGVFDLISTVLEEILNLAKEMLSFFFDLLSDSLVTAVRSFFSLFSDTNGSLFDFFHKGPPPEEDEDGNLESWQIGLPSDVAAVFAFFSGAVMALPVGLRSLLIFGVAAMILFSVFKMVSRH